MTRTIRFRITAICRTMIEKITKINTYHMSLFAYFLERLKATKEGDGTLLDHSMIVYGGAICDGNSHSHEDLPVLLAGRGDGQLKTGRHIQYPEGHSDDEPLSLVARADECADGTLGDSTGQLQHLSEL